MSTPQKPTSNIAKLLLHLISIGAFVLGLMYLLFAVGAPGQSSSFDTREMYYVAGLYYIFMTWTMFGIAAGVQAILYFIRRGEQA